MTMTHQMTVIDVNKFNEQGEAKWMEDRQAYLKLHPNGNDRPELRNYVYFKSYGYVATDGTWSAWAKTKKEAEQKAKSRLTAHQAILPLM